LNEREILDAAIEIVERDGVDGLTMPALARHLDATTMSTYRYFRGKDELLIAMTDRALKEVCSGLPPAGDGPWEDELVRLMMELYKALQRAPLYVRLCQSDPKLLLPRPAAVSVWTERLEAELKVLQPLRPCACWPFSRATPSAS
jgi:AcrR family transcriptional regulator